MPEAVTAGAVPRRLVFDFRPDDGRRAERRIFADPVEVVGACRLDEVAGVLAAAEAGARRGLYVAGFLCYEAAPAFDDAFETRPPGALPLAWFGLYDRYGIEGVRSEAVERPEGWSLDVARPTFEQRVELIREAIADGSVYQVNYTVRQRARLHGSAAGWYEEMRRAQGPGYHALLEFDDRTIVSVSPELFVARRGAQLLSRPMKGTRPRGRWVAEDDALRTELEGSAKDRAELLMIVDLVRNDMGRVARPGSVAVPALHTLEQYPTVWQMTATVTADTDASLEAIMGALFPGGSVTGAPKISAMRYIRELETSPRGIYCGAIGVIEPGGDFTFNLPIRTAVVDAEGLVEYGVGAGITWDSGAADEYAEVRAKAVVASEPWPEFELLETMAIEHGVVLRRASHLERIHASARYFGFPAGAVETELERALQHHGNATGRLRMLLTRTGAVRIHFDEIEPTPERPTVKWAPHPVDARNRFLYHKTTHRAWYDHALASQPDAFDVLLRNELGQVTEFTRGNIVIETIAGLLTPALHCGLLPGVLREEMLRAGTIREAVLRAEDVASARRLWRISSLRGWVEVELLPETPVRDPARAPVPGRS